MQAVIREAKNADSNAAAEVVKVVYEEYGFSWEPEGYHADLYDLQTYYLDPGHCFLVAEIDGVVVGTASLEQFAPLPGEIGEELLIEGTVRIGGCDCALNRLYVHPDARRKGVARALVTALFERAHAHNCQAMEIWSDKRFTAAHELYAAFGARQISDRICDDPDVSPEWGLVIDLRS
jgi:GNAT superfamily N-acetyltransferase